jgi:hypothetical protein
MIDRSKRGHQRCIKRLEVKFSSDNKFFTGISSDLSENGLFIRTQKGFAPGTAIDIQIFLPDGNTSIIKGIVKRTIKSSISALKNGMGIEIMEKDKSYINFLKSFK